MSTEGVARSRRAVLGAAIGGAAAVAAQAVARPLPVAAANGDNAILGTGNVATDETQFSIATADVAALAGVHTGAGPGARAVSQSSIGLRAASLDDEPSDFPDGSHRAGVAAYGGDSADAATNTDETGVYGFSSISDQSTGVWGDSVDGTGVVGSGVTGVVGTGDWGLFGDGASAGMVAYTASGVAVFGTALNFSEIPAGQSVGVLGAGPASGVGVYGFAGNGQVVNPPDGVAVYAHALTTSQTALYVNGKAKFSRSGRVSIGGSASSKSVSKAGVTSSSYVVATLQTNVSGVYVRAVVPSSGAFKIYLNKAAGKTVYVGYLVIN